MEDSSVIKKKKAKKNSLKNLKKFKKGESGNPKGRPQGSVSVTSAIKRKLLEVFPDTKGKKNKEKKLYLDKLVDGILKNAIENGEARSQRDIWAYMDGHPKATIDIGADKEDLDKLTKFFRIVAKKKNE